LGFSDDYKFKRHFLNEDDINLNSEDRVDIDLLLCDDVILHTSELTLPHPRLHERRFVLHPLHDLAPNLIPPGHSNPVSILLELCESKESPPLLISETW
jgi:7,8-dihydro-6-hydroxymethylpterin-pyrophosphokinase